jgi:hypothetical protein
MQRQGRGGPLRRIGRDVKRRRNLDAYVVSAIATVFAALSVIGDIVPEGPRWAVLLAGIGLLVYRITLPERTAEPIDELLLDRTGFEQSPLTARLRNANEVWVFAPSAVNILAPQHCDMLRRTVLAHASGVVKVVVLDPDDETAVRTAVKHLDDTLDQPLQLFRSSLTATIAQLRRMTHWQVNGMVEYRLLDFNPGFSLVAIDPGAKGGTVVVEFHGIHHESVTSRMHIEITRDDSRHWYAHWLNQFDHIWRSARPPSADS